MSDNNYDTSWLSSLKRDSNGTAKRNDDAVHCLECDAELRLDPWLETWVDVDRRTVVKHTVSIAGTLVDGVVTPAQTIVTDHTHRVY